MAVITPLRRNRLQHPPMRSLLAADYGMAESKVAGRKRAGFPPYAKGAYPGWLTPPFSRD
jgi:hypothetical protein